MNMSMSKIKIPAALISKIMGHVADNKYTFELLYTLRELMGFERELAALVGDDIVMDIDCFTSDCGFIEYPSRENARLLSERELATKESELAAYLSRTDIMNSLREILCAAERLKKS